MAQTYRFTFHGTPVQGTTALDVLARAVQTADALTIVEDGRVRTKDAAIVVTYKAEGAAEARATARAILRDARYAASVDSGTVVQTSPSSAWSDRVHVRDA